MQQPRIDVRTTPFKRAARGFDPDEVQDFLQLLASDYDEAHAERDRVRDALAAVTREAEQLRETDRSLMRLLAASEEDARAQAAAARREAARILEAAEARAAGLVGSLEQRRHDLESEIAAIRARRHRAQGGLQGLIDELSGGIPGPVVSGQLPVPAPGGAADWSRLSPAIGGAETPGGPAPSRDDASLRAVAVDLSEAHALPEVHASPEVLPAEAWIAASPQTAPDDLPLAAVVEPAEDTSLESRLEQPSAGVVRASRSDASLDVVPDCDPVPVGTASEPEEATDDPVPQQQEVLAELSPVHPRRALGRWAGAAVVGTALLCVAAVAWPGRTETRTHPVNQVAATAPPLSEPEAVESARAPAPLPADPLVVRLSAIRSCWVRLVVDGRPESRTIEAGEEIVRGARAAVELRVGDAAALTVEVNGAPQPPLGRDGQVVDRRFEVGTAYE